MGVVFGGVALVAALELDFVAAGFAGETEAFLDEAAVTMFSTCAQGWESCVRFGTMTIVTVPTTRSASATRRVMFGVLRMSLSAADARSRSGLALSGLSCS
ncbi:MAG TPA: hypothetical protein PKI89_00750 [Tepidiformaceae bacterium]|nr:hypothetical protein [Tepidiformaceae bacterium]